VLVFNIEMMTLAEILLILIGMNNAIKAAFEDPIVESIIYFLEEGYVVGHNAFFDFIDPYYTPATAFLGNCWVHTYAFLHNYHTHAIAYLSNFCIRAIAYLRNCRIRAIAYLRNCRIRAILNISVHWKRVFICFILAVQLYEDYQFDIHFNIVSTITLIMMCNNADILVPGLYEFPLLVVIYCFYFQYGGDVIDRHNLMIITENFRIINEHGMMKNGVKYCTLTQTNLTMWITTNAKEDLTKKEMYLMCTDDNYSGPYNSFSKTASSKTLNITYVDLRIFAYLVHSQISRKNNIHKFLYRKVVEYVKYFTYTQIALTVLGTIGTAFTGNGCIDMFFRAFCAILQGVGNKKKITGTRSLTASLYRFAIVVLILLIINGIYCEISVTYDYVRNLQEGLEVLVFLGFLYATRDNQWIENFKIRFSVMMAIQALLVGVGQHVWTIVPYLFIARTNFQHFFVQMPAVYNNIVWVCGRVLYFLAGCQKRHKKKKNKQQQNPNPQNPNPQNIGYGYNNNHQLHNYHQPYNHHQQYNHHQVYNHHQLHNNQQQNNGIYQNASDSDSDSGSD
jgi:hypothetical protein